MQLRWKYLGTRALTIFLSPWLALADCPPPNLPASLKLNKNFFSWTNSFSLLGGDTEEDLGSVSERFFAMTRNFDWERDGNTIATAKQRAFSWGSTVDIFDCEGKKIGSIKENVWRSLFKVFSEYSILDANGVEIGKSEKQEWLGTDIKVSNPSGAVAQLNRRFFSGFTDKWTIQLAPNGIDPRLILFIGAYKSAADADEARASAASLGRMFSIGKPAPASRAWPSSRDSGPVDSSLSPAAGSGL